MKHDISERADVILGLCDFLYCSREPRPQSPQMVLSICGAFSGIVCKTLVFCRNIHFLCGQFVKSPSIRHAAWSTYRTTPTGRELESQSQKTLYLYQSVVVHGAFHPRRSEWQVPPNSMPNQYDFVRSSPVCFGTSSCQLCPLKNLKCQLGSFRSVEGR